MGIIGTYNKLGYEILKHENGQITEQIYTGGNNPFESSSTVPVERGLPLSRIKEFCEQTGREIAEERGDMFLGCEEEEEDIC